MSADPIGDWYRRHAKEARQIGAKLDEARKRGAPREEIRRLEQALELARYVGD